MADLRTRVGALELLTPVVAASGTYGYGLEYDGLVDWRLVGAVSVKGLSTEPCDGVPAPRMIETPAGMLNAIGLQNIGVEAFLRDKLPRLRDLPVRVVVNCWGNSEEEYEEVVTRLDGAVGIDALELNLACPNKREWKAIFACDPELTARITARVRKRTNAPLWVKLSPNVTDIRESARAAAGEGADALCLINTVRGMAIDVETRRPMLSNTTGGLSGPAIKPIGVFMTYEAARTVDIPIVGCGGVTSGIDVVEYLLAGASAVQVGTANLYDPAAPARVAAELADWLDQAGEPAAAALIGKVRSPASL